MKIVHLDKEMAFKKINDLIEIDRIIPDDFWTSDNFLMDLGHKWEYSLVALDNDLVVGFLICSVKENNIHIHRIAVSPDYQRKKLGSVLMEHLFADCYNSGIKSITLKVQDFNIGAQIFYEKLGFKKEGSHKSRHLYKKVIQ